MNQGDGEKEEIVLFEVPRDIGRCEGEDVLLEDGELTLARKRVLSADSGKWFFPAGEEITRFDQAKKVVFVPLMHKRGGRIRFYAYEYPRNKLPLLISVNGHIFEYSDPAGRGKLAWRTLEVPTAVLMRGDNEIIFSSTAETFSSWILGIAAPEAYGASSKSTDGGKTWRGDFLGFDDSAKGEYMVRLELDAYPERGVLTSPPLALSRNGETTRLDVVASAEIQEGQEVRALIRFGVEREGTDPVWTGWREFPIRKATLFTSLSLCQMQIVLSSEEASRTPAVRGLTLRGTNISGERRQERSVRFERRFEAGDQFDNSFQTAGIAFSPGSAHLRKRRDVMDEEGRLFHDGYWKKNRRWGDDITDTKWAKKILVVKDIRVEYATLVLYADRDRTVENPPLYIDVNGHPYTLDKIEDAPDRRAYWHRIVIDPAHLRVGENEIVFRSEDNSTWTLPLQNGTTTFRSARSLDRGKTWDFRTMGSAGNLCGEYCVRLKLGAYAERGEITSRPIDVWSLTGGPDVRAPYSLSDLSLADMDGDVPDDTKLKGQVRFGTSRFAAEETWTEWIDAEEAAHVSGAFPFVQWRAVLSTGNAQVTPVLRGLTLKGTVNIQSRAESVRPHVKVVHPEIRESSWSYIYQRADSPRLKLLREKLKLDEVVAPYASQFDKLKALRHYTCEIAENMAHKEWQVYPSESSLTFLTWSENDATGHYGRTTGTHCHQRAYLYIQACLALGYQARSAMIAAYSPDLRPIGHCTTEVWIDELKKWVYMESTADFHVVRKGVPLNLWEVHEIVTGRMNPADMTVLYDEGKGMDESYLDKQPVLYERYALLPRNNQLDAALPGPYNSGTWKWNWNGFRWAEEHQDLETYPDTGGKSTYTHFSDRKDDFDWTLNQCYVRLKETADPESVLLVIDSNAPNLDHFELEDGEIIVPEGRYLWKLPDVGGQMSIRAVNAFGVRGMPTTIVRE